MVAFQVFIRVLAVARLADIPVAEPSKGPSNLSDRSTPTSPEPIEPSPSLHRRQPLPSDPLTTTPAAFTTNTTRRRRGPPTPTKVHFLDPTGNVITELEPFTPPISVPPSPSLGTIDLPPTSSGYSTPTFSESVEFSPRQPAQKTRIHRVLYQANDLQFDAGMTLQPLYDTPMGRSSPVFEYDAATLAEPATSPPLPSLLLVCDNFPWKIRVSSSLPKLFVTNYDVLQTIHRNLRTPVAAAEWSLCGSAQDREVILQTIRRRVRGLPNEITRTEEGARSAKRVDWLMGSTRLVRIVPSEDPEVFVMEWGRP